MAEEARRHLLPIGSVVTLRGEGPKPAMIIARAVTFEGEPERDYLGVLWPEGYLGGGLRWAFSRDDVEGVLFLGFRNGKEEALRHVLESGGGWDAEFLGAYHPDTANR